MFDRFFRLRENGTSVRTELTAGLVTFLTMAYIIFVQPAVLSGKMFNMDTGMDFGALTAATCYSAAIGTLIMGLWARYPVALAPGMGENFFFVFTAIPVAAAAGYAVPWQAALGAVFVSGLLFVAVSLVGARKLLMDLISPSMKHGIAVGIGFFIAFIGFQNAGLILKDPGTAVKLNPRFDSPDLIVFFVGLFVMAGLYARKVRGAILIGLAVATALAVGLKLWLPFAPAWIADAKVVKDSILAQRFQIATSVVSAPPSVLPTLFKMDIAAAFSLPMLPIVIIFLYMAVFDTIGTLIGVGQQAGLLRDNQLPRVERAFLADSVGTVAGAAMGTSTVTAFIESAAGVEHGGRTGLTAVATAALFLVAPCFAPLVVMVGGYPPITAPALVLVGAMMMGSVTRIDWDDPTEALPAFLTVLGIPLCYSIADGLTLGFISYPIIKLLSGRGREVGVLMYGLAAVLVCYFLFVRAGLA